MLVMLVAKIMFQALVRFVWGFVVSRTVHTTALDETALIFPSSPHSGKDNIRKNEKTNKKSHSPQSSLYARKPTPQAVL